MNIADWASVDEVGAVQDVGNHPLLDVLTADSRCPVCHFDGIPISDDAGIAYAHGNRHYLCRVTPRLLEGA